MKEKAKKLKDMAKVFEQSREDAATHMVKILAENKDNEAFMIMAMLEVCIDATVDSLGPEEAAELLRDIADQIEEGSEEGDDFDMDSEDDMLEEDEDMEDEEKGKH